MRVMIDVKVHHKGDDAPVERELAIVGHPDEDLERGMVLLITPEVSFEVSHRDLQRALKAFEWEYRR